MLATNLLRLTNASGRLLSRRDELVNINWPQVRVSTNGEQDVSMCKLQLIDYLGVVLLAELEENFNPTYTPSGSASLLTVHLGDQ